MPPSSPAAFNVEDALEQLFSATVNQQPLEEAVTLMLWVSGSDRGYHEEIMRTFNFAQALIDKRDKRVIRFINGSGYRVSSFVEADELISDFLTLYEGRYNARAAQ